MGDYSFPNAAQSYSTGLGSPSPTTVGTPKFEVKYTQWSEPKPNIFATTSKTISRLSPGMYNIMHDNDIGTVFEANPISVDGIIRFPGEVYDRVFNRIRTFWDSDAIYKTFDMTHKTGIFLYGPPGTGKSFLVRLTIKDVIERGGVVLTFESSYVLKQGLRKFRQIDPTTPIVCMMEDLDEILENGRNDSSEILNIIDGVESINNIVFLATTNHPEKLDKKITNRPSRFDKRYFIGPPNEECRLIFLKALEMPVKESHSWAPDINRWVKDTKGFSLAHIKELFCDVHIFKTPYNEALTTLKEMSKFIASDNFEGSTVGLR